MATRDLRQRILDAAAQVLSEGGPRPRLITNIAERAQVSRPTLYRHFPERNDLYDSLMRVELERVVDAVAARARTSTSPRSDYVEVVVGLVRTAREHPALQAVLARHPEIMASHLPRVLPIVLEIAEPRLGPILEAGAREGRWPAVPVRPAITWTTRLVVSLVTMPPAEAGDADLAAEVETLITVAGSIAGAGPAEG